MGVPLIGGAAIGISIAPEIKEWYPTIRKVCITSAQRMQQPGPVVMLYLSAAALPLLLIKGARRGEARL